MKPRKRPGCSLRTVLTFGLLFVAYLRDQAFALTFSTNYNAKPPYSISTSSQILYKNGVMIHKETGTITNKDTKEVFPITASTFFSDNGKFGVDPCTGKTIHLQGESTFFKTNMLTSTNDGIVKKGQTLTLNPGEDMRFADLCLGARLKILKPVSITAKEDIRFKDLEITATGAIVNVQSGESWQMPADCFLYIPNDAFEARPAPSLSPVATI